MCVLSDGPTSDRLYRLFTATQSCSDSPLTHFSEFESVGTMSRDQPSLYLAAGAAPRQTRFWYVGHRKIHAAETQQKRHARETRAVCNRPYMLSDMLAGSSVNLPCVGGA